MAGQEVAACEPQEEQRNERGVVTAEYAAMMVGGVSLVGILIKVLSDPRVQELIFKLIEWIVNLIFKLVH